MGKYNPIDYKIERSTSNKNDAQNPKMFDFKIYKREIVYLVIIIIQFVLLYNINDRLSLVEETFKKQLDKYQEKLEKNEAAIKQLEYNQRNKFNK